MKNITLFIIMTLVGCGSTSFMSYHSESVFIDGNEITILFQVEKMEGETNLNPHNGGRTWSEWSKLYKAKYTYDFDDLGANNKLTPDSLEIIEEKKGEIKSYQYLITKNGLFNKTGVRSKNRKYVLAQDNKGFYNTDTGELIKDLKSDAEYNKFINIIKSQYLKQYSNNNLYGEVSTHFVVTNNGKYIVIFPAETSHYDFIDFNTINIFDIETSTTSSFRFDTSESKYEGFRIIDVEFVNNQWICLFGYHGDNGFKSATWYSKNIQILPFDFYSRGEYDIWNIEKEYFAKLSSFDSEYEGKEYELKIYKYDSSEPIVLKLNTQL